MLGGVQNSPRSVPHFQGAARAPGWKGHGPQPCPPLRPVNGPALEGGVGPWPPLLTIGGLGPPTLLLSTAGQSAYGGGWPRVTSSPLWMKGGGGRVEEGGGPWSPLRSEGSLAAGDMGRQPSLPLHGTLV